MADAGHAVGDGTSPNDAHAIRPANPDTAQLHTQMQLTPVEKTAVKVRDALHTLMLELQTVAYRNVMRMMLNGFVGKCSVRFVVVMQAATCQQGWHHAMHPMGHTPQLQKRRHVRCTHAAG